MSGIVGSKLNIRGSGLVGSLGTDGQHLLSSGAGLTNIFETAAAGGITETDQWRLATSRVDGSFTLDANLERADHAGSSVLGSGMSESSGVFSFPSTGYWLVLYNQVITSNLEARSITSKINTTSDNSTYVSHYSTGHVVRAEDNFTGISQSNACVMDVTNVSNDKCFFSGASSGGACTVEGTTAANTTTFTFIRLGDT